MKWGHLHMPLLDEPLESHLVLSKAEVNTLKRAQEILTKIRSKLDDAFGEDEVVDIKGASSWVYAECYFSEAVEELRTNKIVTEPVPENKRRRR